MVFIKSIIIYMLDKEVRDNLTFTEFYEGNVTYSKQPKRKGAYNAK